MKLLIAHPTYGLNPYYAEMVIAWATLERPNDWAISVPKRLPHHLARNKSCYEMLEDDYTHILFWDDDVLPPRDAIKALSKHDKDIVITPIMNRQAGFVMVYKDGKMTTGKGLKEVDSGSMGLVLMKREVVEALFKKYDGYPFEFLQRDQLEKDKPTGEDIVFFDRAREAGFKVFCDFDVRPKHLANYQALKYEG